MAQFYCGRPFNGPEKHEFKFGSYMSHGPHYNFLHEYCPKVFNKTKFIKNYHGFDEMGFSV